MTALMIQGRPRQTRMSNVFDPMLFDTAIDPLPWSAFYETVPAKIYLAMFKKGQLQASKY
jgi:hypothetical protein